MNKARESLEDKMNEYKKSFENKVSGLEDELDKLTKEKKELENDLMKEIEALKKEIKDLNKEKNNIAKELESEKAKSEKDKQEMSDKLNGLDDRITNLESEKVKLEETDKKQKERIETLEDDVNELKEELETEKDKNNLREMNLPEGIKVNQWYPDKVVRFPDKRRYDDGESIDMNGMKMRFRRVVKTSDGYKEETKDVYYRDFKNGYKGWNFNLKTKTAKYDESTHGKMKIRFSFILKNAEKSW